MIQAGQKAVTKVQCSTLGVGTIPAGEEVEVTMVSTHTGRLRIQWDRVFVARPVVVWVDPSQLQEVAS